MSVEYSTIPLALRGARRDVDDHGVTGIFGIHLTERAPDKLLVLAHVAERHALERRRLHARNHDSGDVRLGQRRPSDRAGKHRDRCHGCTAGTSPVRWVIAMLPGKL